MLLAMTIIRGCHMTILLILGLLFLVLSLLTTIISYYDWFKHNKHTSPFYVPFVGPVLLAIWIFGTHKPLWLIPIVLVCDIGTDAFIIATPRLFMDWWNTCSFTRILNLHGSAGIQTATLTFHSTGRYYLSKEWHRSSPEPGPISVGDIGSFARKGDIIEMKSDWGWLRKIRLVSDGRFAVIEEVDVREKEPDYSIANWTFDEQKSK